MRKVHTAKAFMKDWLYRLLNNLKEREWEIKMLYSKYTVLRSPDNFNVHTVNKIMHNNNSVLKDKLHQHFGSLTTLTDLTLHFQKLTRLLRWILEDKGPWAEGGGFIPFSHRRLWLLVLLPVNARWTMTVEKECRMASGSVRFFLFPLVGPSTDFLLSVTSANRRQSALRYCVVHKCQAVTF
jgi:hypothetical protein